MAQILPLRLPDAPPDDGEVVARAIEGDAWARRELFQRHAPRLVALLVRLLGSHADAEDAAQDAFVEAFRDLKALETRGDFGRWLVRIAVHQAHRRFRRRKFWALFGRRPELDARFEAITDDRVTPERRAELVWLDEFLADQPALDRTIYLLRHVEEFELTEIAHAVGASLATVKRKLSAISERLEKHRRSHEQ
ncbi:MAG: sigma-70 family RNA polymerase sigma factor [Myxococcaceae bacterium]